MSSWIYASFLILFTPRSFAAGLSFPSNLPRLAEGASCEETRFYFKDAKAELEVNLPNVTFEAELAGADKNAARWDKKTNSLSIYTPNIHYALPAKNTHVEKFVACFVAAKRPYSQIEFSETADAIWKCLVSTECPGGPDIAKVGAMKIKAAAGEKTIDTLVERLKADEFDTRLTAREAVIDGYDSLQPKERVALKRFFEVEQVKDAKQYDFNHHVALILKDFTQKDKKLSGAGTPHAGGEAPGAVIQAHGVVPVLPVPEIPIPMQMPREKKD